MDRVKWSLKSGLAAHHSRLLLPNVLLTHGRGSRDGLHRAARALVGERSSRREAIKTQCHLHFSGMAESKQSGSREREVELAPGRSAADVGRFVHSTCFVVVRDVPWTDFDQRRGEQGVDGERMRLVRLLLRATAGRDEHGACRSLDSCLHCPREPFRGAGTFSSTRRRHGH